jgi:hypothetical protein
LLLLDSIQAQLLQRSALALLSSRTNNFSDGAYSAMNGIKVKLGISLGFFLLAFVAGVHLSLAA